uniref:NADH dehydrogenase subunit 6 n=1 Tax=Bulla sp. TLT-2006 TaxID=407128 RepID=E6Y145_9GAST|nr:NADH dehydrogenase subunit 6 [Bulla sp. TLT-2006]
MKLFSLFCLSTMFLMPFAGGPLSLGALLVLLSLGMVCGISVVGSWWYSYVLFLVYIGGLLVMFIYVCLISSNNSFTSSMSVLGVTAIVLFSSLFLSSKFMNKVSLFDAGSMFMFSGNLWAYIGLVLLLLMMLLVIVRSSGSGSVVVS